MKKTSIGYFVKKASVLAELGKNPKGLSFKRLGQKTKLGKNGLSDTLHVLINTDEIVRKRNGGSMIYSLNKTSEKEVKKWA